MNSTHYFYAMVEGLAIDALALKRELFDAGSQEAHNKVAHAETELRNAMTVLKEQMEPTP